MIGDHGQMLGIPLSTPCLGTDAILGERNDCANELHIKYKKEAIGIPSETVSIRLGPDYHSIETSSGRTIYDYRLRRIFRISIDGVFTNDSLYAEVWYRLAELQNRSNIQKALSGTVVGRYTTSSKRDLFWDESELGVVSSRADQQEFDLVQSGFRAVWRRNDEELAAVRYGLDTVQGKIRPGLLRLWLSLAQLHPQIAHDMATQGRMPVEFWFKSVSRDLLKSCDWHWTLIESKWHTDCKYPLEPGKNPKASTTSGCYPEIYSALSEAIYSKAKPPTEDVYVARIEAAIARGEGLEALLWTIEMKLACGTSSHPSTSSNISLYTLATQLAKSDPRTALAFDQASPSASARSAFADLPNANLLGALWATRPAGADITRADTERDLLTALATMPIANLCKDAGDFYLSNWCFAAAWQVWDFGRAMASHRAGDLLDSIDEFESRLIQDAPHLF